MDYPKDAAIIVLKLAMIKRILILGAGKIAHDHAEAARRLPGPPKIAAADPSEAALQRLTAAFAEIECYGSVDAMLALPLEGTEVAIVATPPYLHYPHVLAALRSGRSILCEKPLTMNAEELRLLHREAQTRGLHLASCSSRFLGRPSFLEAKRLFDSPTLGDGLRITWRRRFSAGRSGYEYQPSSRWFLDKGKAGGGCLFDWGCYDFTTLHALIEPRCVTINDAWLGYPVKGKPLDPGLVFDVETQVCASLRYVLRDGRTLHMDYERSTACFGPEIDLHLIEGDRGALTWDWLDWEGHSVTRYWDAAGEPHHSTIFCPDVAGLDPMSRPLIQLDAALSGRLRDQCWDADAAFDHELLCALYETAADGKVRSLNHE
ncbi:putative UDP-kanosamine synthase oxidoreductase subunit [mine drainage metagenome]|uniref:Putative UDP-kanosamine synthase oxidoreductase subunit n=1 Tax=mine drainage metagenome TaxID=410659 RepID=A0A1J5RPQ1_9ZZZZ